MDSLNDTQPTGSDFNKQLNALKIQQMQQLEDSAKGGDVLDQADLSNGIPDTAPEGGAFLDDPSHTLENISQKLASVDLMPDSLAGWNVALDHAENTGTFFMKDAVQQSIQSKQDTELQRQQAAQHPVYAMVGDLAGLASSHLIAATMGGPVGLGAALGEDVYKSFPGVVNSIKLALTAGSTVPETVASSALQAASPAVSKALIASNLLNPDVVDSISKIAGDAVTGATSLGTLSAAQNVQDRDLNAPAMESLTSAGIKTLHDTFEGALFGAAAPKAVEGLEYVANKLGFMPSEYGARYGDQLKRLIKGNDNYGTEPHNITEPTQIPHLSDVSTADLQKMDLPPPFVGIPGYSSDNMTFTKPQKAAYLDSFDLAAEGVEDPKKRQRVLDTKDLLDKEILPIFEQDAILSKKGQSHPDIDNANLVMNLLGDNTVRNKVYQGDLNIPKLWKSQKMHDETADWLRSNGYDDDIAKNPRPFFVEGAGENLNKVLTLDGDIRIDGVDIKKRLTDITKDSEIPQKIPDENEEPPENMVKNAVSQATNALDSKESSKLALNQLLSTNLIAPRATYGALKEYKGNAYEKDIAPYLSEDEKKSVESQRLQNARSSVDASGKITRTADASAYDNYKSNVRTILQKYQNVKTNTPVKTFNTIDSLINEINNAKAEADEAYRDTNIKFSKSYVQDMHDSVMKPLMAIRNDNSLFPKSSIIRANLASLYNKLNREHKNLYQVLGKNAEYTSEIRPAEINEEGKLERPNPRWKAISGKYFSKLKTLSMGVGNTEVRRSKDIVQLIGQHTQDIAKIYHDLLRSSPLETDQALADKFLARHEEIGESTKKSVDYLNRLAWYNDNRVFQFSKAIEANAKMSPLGLAEQLSSGRVIDNIHTQSYGRYLSEMFLDAASGNHGRVLTALAKLGFKGSIDLIKGRGPETKTALGKMIKQKNDILTESNKRRQAIMDSYESIIKKREKAGKYGK